MVLTWLLRATGTENKYLKDMLEIISNTYWDKYKFPFFHESLSELVKLSGRLRMDIVIL